jgi:hypothetical protein
VRESRLADDEQQAADEPSVEELIEQIRGIAIGQFLLSTVSTLASLTFAKLDGGDLAQTRTGIEGLRALIPVLEGEIDPGLQRDLEATLANLQVAYADAMAAGE